MRVVHLSDPHLSSGPTAAGPALGLELVLRRAVSLDPQPDCLIVTGDLVDRGRPGEYADLRRILDDVPSPVHLAIGNHDDRDAFIEAFAGSRYLNGGSRSHYAVEYAEASVLVLDSKDDSTAAGYLGSEQLGWLDDQLAQGRDVPTLICLHHPPVPVGIPAMDAIKLANADELQEVLSRHSPSGADPRWPRTPDGQCQLCWHHCGGRTEYLSAGRVAASTRPPDGLRPRAHQLPAAPAFRRRLCHAPGTSHSYLRQVGHDLARGSNLPRPPL